MTTKLAPWPIPKGRAATDQQKEECLAKLLEVWKDPRHTQLRLGQLLVNAHHLGSCTADLFYVEDLALIDSVVEFGQKYISGNLPVEKEETDGD
jgi:hypothetical protein